MINHFEFEKTIPALYKGHMNSFDYDENNAYERLLCVCILYPPCINIFIPHKM